MKVRAWLALTALLVLLIGCSRADPSLIATLPAEDDGATPGEPGNMVVNVSADPGGLLQYVETTLNGPADQAFTVNFDNPSPVEHNWVMVEPGQEDAVVQAAQAQAGAIDNVNGIIAGHNPIANSSDTIDVPATPAGTYTYLCTVPGHYAAGMHGEITLGAVADGGQPAGGEQPAGGAQASGATEATVSADPSGQLRFAEETMSVAANQPLTITFNNPSPVEHNWVLVEPGQEDAVASAALAAGGDPTNLAGVIAGHAPITNSSDTIEVEPLQPGTYPYICTVPGHYQAGMRGTLTAGP